MYYDKDHPSGGTILELMKTVNVKIKPGAKEAKVVEKEDVYGNQSLEVFVKALPKKGEANAEMIKILGKYFSVPKSHIKIKSGFKSRNKIILVQEKVSKT